jgi:hypothetical protein
MNNKTIKILKKENIMEPLQKVKIELPYYPAIPLLGMYPKEFKSGYNKDTCTYTCLLYTQ